MIDESSMKKVVELTTGERSPRGMGTSPGEACARALVVDDEMTMVTLVGLMLETFGFQVDVAHGSREALRLLHKHGSYDLVVTDLYMPDMNGYALAGRVKRRSPATTVIIMTGCRASSESYRNSPTCPVDSWIFKPFGFEELETLLREYFLV